MSLLRTAARRFPRAALTSARPGTASSPLLFRSASTSTSSGTTLSPPWIRGRPKQSAPAPASSSKKKRPSTPKKCYRAVHITGLDPSVTLTSLIQSIAETAPVGMITSARLNPRTPSFPSPQGPSNGLEAPQQPTRAAPPLGDGKRKEAGTRAGTQVAGDEGSSGPTSQLKADIIFGNEDAPEKLTQLARRGTFLVHGRAPFVAVNTDLPFHGPKVELRRSRVVHIRGPAEADWFTEGALRGVLASDAVAVNAVGALDFDSEAVVETRLDGNWDGEGGGEGDGSQGEGQEQGQGQMRLMEWRFFDVVQARACKRALREHYGRRLHIQNAPDPCWDYVEMTNYLRAKGVGQKALDGLRRNPFDGDNSPSTPVYPAYFLEEAVQSKEGTSIEEGTPGPTSTKEA